jgi:hypothetical protein
LYISLKKSQINILLFYFNGRKKTRKAVKPKGSVEKEILNMIAKNNDTEKRKTIENKQKNKSYFFAKRKIDKPLLY